MPILHAILFFIKVKTNYVVLYIRYVKLYSQKKQTSSSISLKHQDVIQFHFKKNPHFK